MSTQRKPAAFFVGRVRQIKGIVYASWTEPAVKYKYVFRARLLLVYRVSSNGEKLPTRVVSYLLLGQRF